ncbi:MAG: SAM-dependent methyltransferase, partial [Desulfobacca sp.]|nr:SAM-dependent methyltransferase [Desulfobacca sp.]
KENTLMYNRDYKGDVCSHTIAFFLDNFLRRMFQNPMKIVGEYITEGNTVIDIGCGPGYFSTDMARLVGPSGKVIAVDLQKEMLEKTRKKAKRLSLEDRIILHHCPQEKIGLNQEIKADFILAYYMVHETPDHVKFFTEVKTLLKKQGKFLLVEPRFHVTKKKFQQITRDVENAGFINLGNPTKKGGHSLLLSL